MTRHISCLLVSAGLALPVLGDDLTLETRPFDVVRTFEARVMPEGGNVHLEIVPKSWKTFRLTRLAAHGTKVAKGETLAAFDTKEIDDWLEDKRAGIAAQEVALSLAGRNLRVLEETAEARLEAAKRAAAIAREENAYFTATRRKSEEEQADQSLKRAERYLANQKEELNQLQKMYAADDLTEETEEIILDRQKDAVQAAEFSLRTQQLAHQRTHAVLLPREAVKLAEAERQTAVDAARQTNDIPETIQSTTLQVAAMKRGLDRDRTTLAEVESDRQLFEFKAPADGWFYHGAIENGRWTTGEILKTLVLHGEPVLRRPVATFVPATARKRLVAFVNEATSRSLETGSAGIATFPGREDLPIEATVASVGRAPETDGTWRVELAAAWPDGLDPAVGSQAEVRLAAYRKDQAIAVPNKALAFGTGGWTVEVKLADGKTQRRPVTRGRANDTHTEIVQGLEAGQVIVVP